MKKLSKLLLAMAASAVLFSSCNNDDDEAAPAPAPVSDVQKTLEGTLSSMTLSADTIYGLKGRVIVPSGVTLTIPAGTIIKGLEGQETNASVLIVARGGKIMAQGTKDKPIIFTSVLDNIGLGQKVGTNLKKTDNQKWGGLIILGKAPISAKDGDDVSSIEGIPATVEEGKYGGTDSTDNSGTLEYVSVRHGGISIGDDNEINGITFGGVGTGTTINWVEVYATLDDGLEFFGGSVNATNVLVAFQGDDGIDIDQNYSGTIDGFKVIHGDALTKTDEGLEIDGPENTLTNGKFTLKNGIVKSIDEEGSAADFKSKAQGTVMNVKFEYSKGAALKFRASYDQGNSCAGKGDALSNLLNGDLVFTNVEFNSIAPYADKDDGCPLSSSDSTSAVGKFSSTTQSITVPDFSWTAASLNGDL